MTNEELEKRIKTMFDGLKNDFLKEDARISLVDGLCEEYYEANGEYPSSNFLDRLSTYILLRDTQARKGEPMLEELMSPYLSERQYITRLRKEAGESFFEITDGHGELIKPITRAARRSWGMFGMKAK